MTLDGLPGPSAQRKPLMKSKKDKLPYLVDPDHLRALQIDPDVYLKSSPVGGWVAWMLDRKKDAALIERLQSMRDTGRGEVRGYLELRYSPLGRFHFTKGT